ncbi:hypothetical protein Tco_0398195 [Tanacetum coccineum]
MTNVEKNLFGNFPEFVFIYCCPQALLTDGGNVFQLCHDVAVLNQSSCDKERAYLPADQKSLNIERTGPEVLFQQTSFDIDDQRLETAVSQYVIS